MTSVWVQFVLIFAVVQLCTAEYVVYGRKTTLKDILSLNPNRCHHPLITQLSLMQLTVKALLSPPATLRPPATILLGTDVTAYAAVLTEFLTLVVADFKTVSFCLSLSYEEV